MKVAVCLFVVFGYSLAIPSPLQEPLPWEDIKGKNAYIKPIKNYTDVNIGARVVGGLPVIPNSVPFQAGLFIDGRNFCGGSLITTTAVLTAAHCTISAASVLVVLGAHDIQTTEWTQVRLTSTSIFNHAAYNDSNYRNDIAVIRLLNDVTLNINVRTIGMTPELSGTYAGSTARITGWGRISDSATGMTNLLQGVSARVITNDECQDIYGPDVVVDSTICTSGAGSVGACQGDSGGPLTVNGILIGVTSFVASRGCQAGLPTGFARISSFRRWIFEHTGAFPKP